MFETARALGALGLLTVLAHLMPAAGASTDPRDGGESALLSGPKQRSLLPAASGFIENRGQWPTAARFVWRRGNALVRADDSGLWLDLSAPPAAEPGPRRGVLVKIGFDGSTSSTAPAGEVAFPGLRHYLLGKDEARWSRGVRSFGRVRWDDLWPGMDLVVHAGDAETLGHYDLFVEPGAAEGVAAFRVEGAEGLAIGPDGSLEIATALGSVRHTPPRAWEELSDGSTRPVAVRFALHGGSRFGFEVAGRDPGRPLVIDPGVVWAGYLGGSNNDAVGGAALAANGDIVVAGGTDSLNFPTTAGAYQTGDAPGNDACITRILADGSAMVFSTYVGGSGWDAAGDVTIDSLDRPVIGGGTNSADFPLSPGAWDSSVQGFDAFALRLTDDGSQLSFSTFVGGSRVESAKAIELAADGGVLLAGRSNSFDFDGTAGAAQAVAPGEYSGFVARVSSDGSLLEWATYLGGSDFEDLFDMALAPDGSIVVCGETQSVNFPSTPGAYDPTHDSIAPGTTSAGFVTKISADGAAFLFSTFLDGSLGSSRAFGVDLSSSGLVAVTGDTTASNFPATAGAYDSKFDQADTDGFVSVLSGDGSTLLYSTSLGYDGTGPVGVDIALEDNGVITVTGEGARLPDQLVTPGAWDSVAGINSDGFVVRFSPDWSDLLYGTLVGGDPGTDGIGDFELVTNGRIAVGGVSLQATFPVTLGAFDTTFAGSPGEHEGVVMLFELQPIGATSFGQPTSACLGETRLTALGEVKAGNAAFAIACVGAPPVAPGILALSGTALPSGLPVAGIQVYLDVTQPLVLLGGLASQLGYREFPLALPLSSAGASFFAQAAWIDTGSCGGTFALSASDALALTIAGP